MISERQSATGHAAPPGRGGFTLGELLVVIAVIAVLASLLLPGLARAKSRAQGVVCLSNMKQLMLGWVQYQDDNRDWLSPSAAGPDAGQHTGNPGWVSGSVSWYVAKGLNIPDITDGATNTEVMVRAGPGKIGPYVGSPGVYRCPGDRSSALKALSMGTPSRVRSYSVNAWIGVLNGGIPPVCETFYKTSDFRRIGPSDLFVMIEEHPWTINDGCFEVAWGYGVEGTSINDFPAMRHGKACPVSFADGHVEMHRWLDPRTELPMTPGVRPPDFIVVPGSVDAQWFGAHATVATEYGASRH